MNPTEKDYIVVVQCHLVKQRCSGYLCEKAFTERAGAFADYPADRDYRTLYMTCGGCCGRAVHRKLANLIHLLAKDGVDKNRLQVHLSSCMALGSYHGPPCPNLDYIRTLIARHDLDVAEGTKISRKAAALRKSGEYEDPSRQ